MKWVTRDHVHMDRVAASWLIRRFIDRGEAEFSLFPSGRIPLPQGEIPFGVPGVELGIHDEAGSTFRKILTKHKLDDPALGMLADIIELHRSCSANSIMVTPMWQRWSTGGDRPRRDIAGHDVRCGRRHRRHPEEHSALRCALRILSGKAAGEAQAGNSNGSTSATLGSDPARASRLTVRRDAAGVKVIGSAAMNRLGHRPAAQCLRLDRQYLRHAMAWQRRGGL